MSFDPTFTYALDYFDGLMGTFFPTVRKLAMLMALLSMAWSGVQIAFGTMEVRKGAVGFLTKFFLFFIVLMFYPAFCIGLRTFALRLGQITGVETTDSVTSSLEEYLEKMQRNNEALARYADGDTKNNEIAAVLRQAFPNVKTKDKDKVAQILKENSDLREELYRILPTDADGNRHISLEFVPKDASGNKRKKVVRTGYNGSQKEDVTVDDVQEGLISLDTVFKLAMVCAKVMRKQAWERDVIKSSSDMQDAKSGTSNAEKIANATEGDDSLYEEAYSAAVELDKVGITVTTIPFKGLIEYIEVLVCSIFVIVLTCVCLIQYAMQMVEYSIVTGFSIVLIPLMLFEGTKDYAMKIIAMLFAQAVKLAMLVMMMYYNFGLYGAMCKAVLSQQHNSFGLAELSFVIFSAILGFAFVANAPKLASTIVTGQPQMSMGEFVGAAAAMGGAAGAMGAAGLTVAKPVAKRAGNGVVGLGKAFGSAGRNFMDIKANGGSLGKALGSAAYGFGASGVANLTSALMGKGSGSASSRHVKEFGKTGALVRQKEADAKVSAKADAREAAANARVTERAATRESKAAAKESKAAAKGSGSSGGGSPDSSPAGGGSSGGSPSSGTVV